MQLDLEIDSCHPLGSFLLLSMHTQNIQQQLQIGPSIVIWDYKVCQTYKIDWSNVRAATGMESSGGHCRFVL